MVRLWFHNLADQSVADAWNRQEKFRVAGITFYLFTQMPDMHFDRLLTLQVRRITPNIFHDLGPCQGLTAMARQIGEQAEFDRHQPDDLRAAPT